MAIFLLILPFTSFGITPILLFPTYPPAPRVPLATEILQLRVRGIECPYVEEKTRIIKVSE